MRPVAPRAKQHRRSNKSEIKSRDKSDRKQKTLGRKQQKTPVEKSLGRKAWGLWRKAWGENQKTEKTWRKKTSLKTQAENPQKTSRENLLVLSEWFFRKTSENLANSFFSSFLYNNSYNNNKTTIKYLQLTYSRLKTSSAGLRKVAKVAPILA